MKMYQLKCPSCGASVEIEKGRETCFCSYCGTKIYVDDDVHRVEITKNIKYHKTYTDEAKIRKIEAEERMQERKYTEEREKRKNEKSSYLRSILVIAVCFIGVLLILVCYSISGKEVSNRQEQELQAIVDDVMQDIEDGNFEEAYIKAEKIRYTENWSSEIKDKWDATRNEVIKQIEKAEKKAYNYNDEETWWNPFD